MNKPVFDPNNFTKDDTMKLMCAAIISAGSFANRFHAGMKPDEAFHDALKIVMNGVDKHFKTAARELF